jgi:hypothetical protein
MYRYLVGRHSNTSGFDNWYFPHVAKVDGIDISAIVIMSTSQSTTSMAPSTVDVDTIDDVWMDIP